MLFDEVTGVLDPETVKEVLVTIREFAEDGMTCIIVAHEMAFAREVDQIYFTDRGVVIEHAPSVDFFTQCRDERIVAYRDRAPSDCSVPILPFRPWMRPGNRG